MPTRRTVLAGTAAAAALAGLPGRGHAARARRPAYRWRTAAIGGTGFVTGLLFHPAVPHLAYARTDIGGAYRWDRHTARWTPLTDHLGWDDWNLLGVEALAVDPAHPDRVYLALGTYAQPWAGPGALLRSEDRGRTWHRTGLPVRLGANEDGRGTGERLLVDPRDSATLWLGTRHDGLLRSADRGATWTRQDGFPATPGDRGQGVTLNGLYRSTDAGAGFTRAPGIRASYTVGFGKAAPGARYPALYQVGAVTGAAVAVLRSDDRGRTWTRIDDDAHQWGWTGQAVTGDPRIHGRVYLATNGRGIQYGEPA